MSTPASRWTRAVAGALVAALLVPAPASAQASRDFVWATGSSTVFPFTTRVAEIFSRKTGRRSPKVEALGTGGGLKAFCSGVGARTPDVANASRQMLPSEFALCQKNGVREIVEIKIGYDGVVVANRREDPTFDLRTEHLYLGLAQSVLRGGKIVRNPYTTWRQVGRALPDQRIRVYGPPPTSGTRDSWVELAMEAGAKGFPTLRRLDDTDGDRFEEVAGTLRRDGGWIDAGENDNALLQTLEKTPGSLGVFGYSFLEQNRERVKPAKVNGVLPSPRTIADGSYPISRSMFIYVKKAHVGVVPGLREFVAEYVSDSAMGRGGYLRDRGLVLLPASQLGPQQAAGRGLLAMRAPAE
jgi:phosphate transport system substrate-binding protein